MISSARRSVPGAKVFLALLLLTVTDTILLSQAKFLVGRIHPSDYDLPELNGLYRPKEAADLCDSHSICAGFTYRGLLNNTVFPEKEYECFFVRYIEFVDDEAFFSNWVSYATTKPFAEYQGLFSGTLLPAGNGPASFVTADNVTDVCNMLTCSAVTVDTKLNRVKGKLLNINLNMKTFQPMKEQKTFVNLNVDSDHVRSTLPKVDTCCPKHTFKHNLTEWIDQVNDTLPRVPCDMDSNEFYHKYMVPRIPVMLVGCTDSWKASKDWSFEKLMRRYGEDITWKCDVSLKDGSPVTLKMLHLDEREYADLIAEKPVKTYEDVLLSGREILELMNLNASVRVFERVGTAPRRERQEDSSSAKPDIFTDWVWPKVFPKDLYMSSFGGSDYQWLIVSQPQTGTHIHQDPVMTDAWNALLSGHKYWAILPAEVNVEQYECDYVCSDKFDDLYTVTWYTHVLPQLRKESWFGRRVMETVQHPGETIYVPHGLGHSVLNLDENVSVTENFLPLTAIDEMAQFFAYNMNPFHFYSEGASKRIWRNLINRDLNKESRRYAKEMLKQVLTVEPPEDVPEFQDDY